jgi:hypothetical protein
MRFQEHLSEGDRVSARLPALADRIRGILATKGLSLYKVSALTRVRYPRDPSYHFPRNFYFQLRATGLSPTLQQVAALSQLSSYRLSDWLAVFGFRLDDILQLQAILHHPRTMVLDSKVYDSGARIPWFRDRSPGGVLPRVAPLSQLLEVFGSPRLSSLLAMSRGSYVYAKVGRQDAFAFPDLIPGSIVRANSRLVWRLLPRSGEISKAFFLVEHSRGFSCCRLHLAAENRVTLMAVQLPFASVELQLGSEARILGVLDLEIRPLTSHRQTTIPAYALPEVAHDLARLWIPAPLDQAGGAQRPSLLLRTARLRAGLSFRHASEMSRTIAAALGDELYFTSPGSLSDYEATSTPPRHIHKLFTVSILYCLDFWKLINSFGVGLYESGMAAIPDEWMLRRDRNASESSEVTTDARTPTSRFVTTLLDRFGEVPFFLRNSLASLSGLPEISLRDVYWVAGQQSVLHPLLAGGFFVFVDHRRRKPRSFRRKSAWEQPLYLLLKRDGSYLLASCRTENGAIVVHPYTEGFVRPERLRNRMDAEVVGQIVSVIRSLPVPP